MQPGTRQRLRWSWIDSTLGDVRFAFRHAARKPLTALTIVAVLAVGIGVHSAVFSLVQGLTTRPAPGVAGSDALVRLRGKEQLGPGSKWFPREFSHAEYLEISAHRELFSATAGWTQHTVSLEIAGTTDGGAVSAQFVTGNFFPALGVQPLLGTALPATERADQSEPELVAVIGHRLWQTAFGASPSAVGQTIRLGNVPVKIIGVAPPRFNGAVPTPGSRTVWLPLSARALIVGSNAQSFAARDSALLQGFARLKEGVTVKQANATVRMVTSQAVQQMRPLAGGGLRDVDVVPLRGETSLPLNDDVVKIAAVYGSIALLILLITCTNVSALVVGAATTRRQEIAIRLSLGASRKRVVRQLLTESVMLSTTAGVVGLLIYWALLQVLVSRLPEMNLTPDIATVAFTLCFAMGTGVLFGLSPALHATRGGLSNVLKDSGASTTTRSRLQRGFVVAQIMFTQPLLAGLAMLLALVMQDNVKQVGDDVAERVILVRFNLLSASGTPQSYEARGAQLEAAVTGLVSEIGAKAMVAEPFGAMTADFTVKAEDRGTLPESGRTVNVHVEATSPGYFALLDIPILYGRDLSAEDSAARDMSVVIGSDLARELWGNINPVGRRFTQKSPYATGAEKEAVVVGVYDARFPTTRGNGIRVYAPQDYRFTASFLIRTDGPAALQLANMRAQIRAALPYVSIGRMQTLSDVNSESRRETLRVSGAAAAGGVLALLLASIGLYGVVALALGQRRREIGIRMALGAKPRQVVSMLFANGVRLSIAGLMLGLPLSLVALRLLSTQTKLPAVNLGLVGAAIAGVVVTVASIATWLPARRAAHVDPVTALRAE